MNQKNLLIYRSFFTLVLSYFYRVIFHYTKTLYVDRIHLLTFEAGARGCCYGPALRKTPGLFLAIQNSINYSKHHSKTRSICIRASITLNSLKQFILFWSKPDMLDYSFLFSFVLDYLPTSHNSTFHKNALFVGGNTKVIMYTL